MRVLITGGAGFIGVRLGRALLARGDVCGQPIEQLRLTDQVMPPADLLADGRVSARVGPLLDQCAALREEAVDLVFHLASAVSAECESDFELGLRSNLDSTRALLDALRVQAERGQAPARLVFSSSLAVFGPDAAAPLPPVVSDDTLPTPQTSYGTHKLIGELLVADYTRKGLLDGRSVRLMTVTVRPGRPNGAASGFFSGIIREPLAGLPAVCPVDPATAHPLSSPAHTVQGLLAAAEASREVLGGRMAFNLPALNVSVGQMLDALAAVAGEAVRQRVRFEPDAAVARIVAGWPQAVIAPRAAALGLQPPPDFETIVHQYIADSAGIPAALAGLVSPA